LPKDDEDFKTLTNAADRRKAMGTLKLLTSATNRRKTMGTLKLLLMPPIAEKRWGL